MGKPSKLASFCRLCLSKTKNRVGIFDNAKSMNKLLQLIELEIDRRRDGNAVICFDCIVTLEGFQQFKSQCHVNDSFLKTIPGKGGRSSDSEKSDEEYDCEYLDDQEHDTDEGLVREEIKVPVKKNSRQKAAAAKRARKTSTEESNSSDEPEHETQAIDIPIKKALNLKREELQVLADEYPDNFHFEKMPKCTYFTLVYYGERFNGALFAETQTTWQCVHRGRYNCPAQVVARNDYQEFERRYEHTHGELPESEGAIIPPLEALPQVFELCDKAAEARFNTKGVRKKPRIKRIKKEKVKPQQKPLSSTRYDSDESDRAPFFEDDDSLIERKHSKDVTIKLKASKTTQNLDNMLVLADSYPDFFYFEKGPRNIYYSMIFYGERYNTAMFKATMTYWQCYWRRKHNCPALVAVTNDYQHFERRFEHTHDPDLTPKVKEGKIYTPKQALPKIFDICRSVVMKKDRNVQQQLVEKYQHILDSDESTGQNDSSLKEKNNSGSAKPGPKVEDFLILQESYPDFFHFEKFERNKTNFAFIFYGERYSSALYSERNTYWQCYWRRKHQCPARVVVSNDYINFERRHEHTHPNLPTPEGEKFTPLEALPTVFKTTLAMVKRNRAKKANLQNLRRKAEKLTKILNPREIILDPEPSGSKSSMLEEETQENEVDEEQVEVEEVELDDDEPQEEVSGDEGKSDDAFIGF